MGITSLQVCMDSSDWLQGTMSEDGRIDSSSPSGDMLTCSRPAMMERRLRPQHDQALKCPRCDSTHTKFCYYNNYSLSQPRYFCKTCRRYWTKGGTLRNIPVGGGCRKNKKNSNSKKSSSSEHQQSINQNPLGSSSSQNPTDLQLSFPEVQFSHLTSLIGANGSFGSTSNFMDHTKYNISVLENPRPIDFMESKFEDLVGNIGVVRSHNFMGSGTDFGTVGGIGDMGHHGLAHNFNGFCTPFGISIDESGSSTFMDTCQRLMLPYHGNDHDNQSASSMDVKPNTKLLSLEWQDQGCSSDHAAGKDSSFGYNINGLTSWGTNIMNGYGPSSTNSLV